MSQEQCNRKSSGVLPLLFLRFGAVPAGLWGKRFECGCLFFVVTLAALALFPSPPVGFLRKTIPYRFLQVEPASRPDQQPPCAFSSWTLLPITGRMRSLPFLSCSPPCILPPACLLSCFPSPENCPALLCCNPLGKNRFSLQFLFEKMIFGAASNFFASSSFSEKIVRRSYRSMARLRLTM